MDTFEFDYGVMVPGLGSDVKRKYCLFSLVLYRQTDYPMTMRTRGTGSIGKIAGSRYLYIWYYGSDGKQRRESSKSESQMVATQLLQKRLGEVRLGMQPESDLKKLRYEEIRQTLLDDYAIRGNRSLRENGTIDGLKHVDTFFKGKSVARIDTTILRAFIKKRQAQGAEAGTINRNLALLRRMFFLVKQEGKVQSVPFFPMLKENAPRKGFVTHEQFEKLIAELPERVRSIVTFLYFTGCRLGEAKKILWSQVDLQNHTVRLEGDQTKNSEPRILPLPDLLVTILESAPKKVGHLFPIGSFRKQWQTSCVAVGLGHWQDPERKHETYEGLIIHDLRRSAVRNMIAAGVNEKVAMQISGHKTRAIFDRYHIVSTDDLHKAMNRVEAAAKALPASGVALTAGNVDTSSMQVAPKSGTIK